jgi:glycosyltransferase involved in cell wall biosynthesis
MVRSRVGIVIPALNEAATIEAVVRQSAVFGTPIVVDDGSSDGTGLIAAAAGAIVVRHEQNSGYDASLNSGFRRAAELDFDIVITIDADGQHNTQYIKQCLGLLDEGVDFVVGVRNKCQRFAEYSFAFVTRALYGLQDPLCGFKGYRMTVYHALGHFDSYGSIGTELALFGVRNGYSFRQLPVFVGDRQGNPRFGQGLRANYKILRSLFRAF